MQSWISAGLCFPCVLSDSCLQQSRWLLVFSCAAASRAIVVMHSNRYQAMSLLPLCSCALPRHTRALSVSDNVCRVALCSGYSPLIRCCCAVEEPINKCCDTPYPPLDSFLSALQTRVNLIVLLAVCVLLIALACKFKGNTVRAFVLFGVAASLLVGVGVFLLPVRPAWTADQSCIFSTSHRSHRLQRHMPSAAMLARVIV